MMKQPVLSLSLALSLTITTGTISWLSGDTAAAAPAKHHAVAKHSSPVTHSATKSSPQVRAGIVAYNKGYILKAIPLFEQAVRHNAKDVEAKLWLAHCYRRQGSPADFTKAASIYQQALTQAPNSVEALSNLGEYLSWNPETRVQAIEMLRKAHQLAPSHAEIDRQLAEALLWNNQGAEALAFSGRIKAQDHKWVSERAQMLGAAGKLDESLSIHQRSLQANDRRNPLDKIVLARQFFAAGDSAKAQTLFAEVYQSESSKPSNQRNPEATAELADFAYTLDKPAESIALDQLLPASYLRRENIQLRHARALERVNRSAEAIEAWSRLYEAQLLTGEQKVEFADYLRSLKLAASDLPNPTLIEALYKEAGQTAPESADASLRLARRFAQSDVLADTQGAHFNDTVQAYKQALASSDISVQASARHELLDYLKSDKTHPSDVEAAFKELSTANPDAVDVKAAYAEYVSWQPDRRAEAIRLYLDLAQNTAAEDTANRGLWQSRLDEVLKWHRPTITLLPLYQQILAVYPQDLEALTAIARSYRNDPGSYRQALNAYEALVQADPENETVKKEWLSLLVSKPGERDANIRLLKALLAKTPAGQEADPDVKATYGKLLSYDHRYGEALTVFDQVLKTQPQHREALLGKGYTVLWSGRKLAAKKFFVDLHQQYPDDVDIAIGLAQTNKMLGRYDLALRLMQDIRPALEETQNNTNTAPPADDNLKSAPAVKPADPTQGESIPQPQSALPGNLQSVVSAHEASLDPFANGLTTQQAIVAVQTGKAPVPTMKTEPVKKTLPLTASVKHHSKSNSAFKASKPAFHKPHAPKPEPSEPILVETAYHKPAPTTSDQELKALQADLDVLKGAVAGVQMLQASSSAQIKHLSDNLYNVKQASVPAELALPGDEQNQLIGEGGMASAYGTFASIDYDTNPILSGVGHFRNNDVASLDKTLTHDLRPMIRGGFQFFRQGGNNTTNRMSGYGFPNQVSMSLTPQLRVRGGVQPTRWYLPHGTSPDSTWANQYGLGATYKPTDRLTLDSDVSITNFTQSHSSNLTFQTQMQYDFTDAISAKLGVRRVPQYNSLLTLTGLRPGQGAFAGSLLGQARENGIYGELNTHPFNPNWDWNAGYEWAFIDGSHVPSNHKNQAFTSFGHTWHFGETQQLRLGYEGLYFGYAKNATNGYFDTTSQGITVPVVSMNPAVLANSKYAFGGYYSPSFFLLNSGRADWRGSLFKHFLEYKLGGSLGLQTATLGHHINEGNNGRTTGLAGSFDSNIILNFTDWLAAYGDVDYLNATGQFNRWRFGGGLIMRPKMDRLSPVIGEKLTSEKPASTKKPSKEEKKALRQAAKSSPPIAVPNSLSTESEPNNSSIDNVASPAASSSSLEPANGTASTEPRSQD
jgi:thioredoxin-like negative regulator of GroEL